MKPPHQIQSEIAASKQLPKFDRQPAITECWNEYERMWRDDNGRCYVDFITVRPYEYHLMYFDGRLAIAERNGVTIFSHVTERLARAIDGSEPERVPTTSDSISLAELIALNQPHAA